MTFLDTLNVFVVSLAGSPWVYLITLAVVIIDGFFPPIPSESVVVALGALAISTGAPNLFLLLLVASVGATTGDTIAYLIGRCIGVDRFRWMRHPRVARAIERARSALDRRAAMLLLTARYIPVGRVAVNMTAGATGFPLRRFLPLAMLAGLSWATYSILIGVLAGAWVHDNPLLGAGMAIVLALVIGFVVDAVLTRVTRRRDARREPDLDLETLNHVRCANQSSPPPTTPDPVCFTDDGSVDENQPWAHTGSPGGCTPLQLCFIDSHEGWFCSE